MKIAVVQKDFYIGGIPSACINFLNCVSKEKDTELTLITFDKIDEKIIPDSVKIVYANKNLMTFAVSNAESKKRGVLFRLRWLMLRVWCKFFTNRLPLKSALKKQKNIEEQYDIAISFSPSSSDKTLSVGSSEFVLEKIKAKKKLVLFHNDFKSSGLNTKFVIDGLSKFDKILCVSESCAESMKDELPQLKDKIDYLYNAVDTDAIKEKSLSFNVNYANDVLNIVSVSRLSEEKGHLRLLQVLHNLIKNGYSKFCYHIVGSGKKLRQIQKYIDQHGMQDRVKLYGAQDNPYPYIKKADLLVLPSYHESFGLVLIESFVLGVPAVTTQTISADEVVGNWGFVCENSEKGIYNQIKEIMDNNELLNEKKVLLKNYKYNNSMIIKKLKYLYEID